MARNDANMVIDEKVAYALGKMDSSGPEVPVLEVGFAVPVLISPAILRPAPISTFPDFFGKLIQIVYDARNVFEEQFPRDTRVTGAAGDQLEDLHVAVNVAGRLLHGLVFYTTECASDPALRYLANKIENAWLDFNAHACRVSPILELQTARALQGEVEEIAGTITCHLPAAKPASPAGKVSFESPQFSFFLHSAAVGCRLARVRDTTITFEGTPGAPVIISLGREFSPRAAGEMLCNTIMRFTTEIITRLESFSIFEFVPLTHISARDALRGKYLRCPTLPPRIFIATHFTLHTRQARNVRLEPSDAVIFDQTLQPGEVTWVALQSWEKGAAVGNEFATYVETPLPEVRNTLLETIRQRAGAREWILEPRIVEIAQEQVATIPNILRDAIATQAQAANDHRKFTVTQFVSAAAAAAVGKAHKSLMPTEVFGTNVFEFRNATAAPFRVKYVVAAKTYNVTISFSKVNVVLWDGASRREVRHEKMAGFLGTIFSDEVPPEASPVLGAFREAMAASQSWEPVTCPVTLFQPMAVPEGFLERYMPEFPMGRVNDP